MWTTRVLVNGLWGGILLMLICAQTGCGQSNDGFERARQSVIAGKFADGDAAMRAVIEKSPRGKHASRAGLFLFKTSLAMGNTDEARKWCQWTIDNHPRSLEAHKCRYKLGMIDLMAGKRGAARERFELLSKSPDGPLAAEAKAMVKFLEAYRIEAEADDVADEGSG